MSRVIYKFNLMVGTSTDISLPIGARALHVAEQHGLLYLWAELPCSPPEPTALRTYMCVGTGMMMIPGDSDYAPLYIGTALMSDGLVWHVYELM